MKTSIETIRQICKLLDAPNQTLKSIAQICKTSTNTVRRYRDIKSACNLDCDFKMMSDLEVAKLFFAPPQKNHSRSIIACDTIHLELQKRDMTLQLLWEEYRQQNPLGISYSQFCRVYKKWKKTAKISMRQSHYPGEHLYVDFCGRTMPIRDIETGTTWYAQVFVGTLGSSSYIFAKAVRSQKIADFLHVNVAMLEHIGGVPKYIVPDNLKSAVILNNKDITQINEAYAELSEHYEFYVLPARPRKPKDKSLAEIGAQIVQRFVLARLRHHIFFSLEELNDQIDHWMSALNNRVTKTYPICRAERLKTMDLDALKPLPQNAYSYSHWAFEQRADESYHVRFNNCWYSVPYTYAHQRVDVRSTGDFVDIYCKRLKIATHALSLVSGTIITNPLHRPPNHAYVSDNTAEMILAWAERIGKSTKKFIEINFNERRYYASHLKSAIKLRKEVLSNNLQSKLEEACEFALSINSYTFQRLFSILKNRVVMDSERPSKQIVHNDNVRGAEYYASALNQNELAG